MMLKIYGSLNSPKEISIAQRTLIDFYEWTERLNLKIAKSAASHFGHRNTNQEYSIEGVTFKSQTTIVDLGVPTFTFFLNIPNMW